MNVDPLIERQREIVLKALEKPTPAERAAYVDGACGTDAGLRREVELLLQHDTEGSFLERPAVEARKTIPGESVVCEAQGTTIGRYKLLQQIGEGGCGVVYMAEQEEPVRRRVALKIIKLGMDTKSVVARFEAERQALALMDHPNIAKVLDGGSTENGRPYFVMELVRGAKITEFCDEKNLSTQDRLDLFVRVCQAVQHAHQKGIIHRDIKPSNVLVTVNDGVAVPKVIDFGIAKATTDQRLTDKTVFTAFEQFIGTPAYMSPEQAEITSVDVDTRSDIYSLGVLLYELLTGKTPFDAAELLKIGLDEMRRTIREKEPARPSTKVSTLGGDELTTTAKRRGLDAPKLINCLRGDLDWIVMKCLEKDRARRYETANGLAADVQRHLSNEPVVACPPSITYLFEKLIRRNKMAVIAAGVVATCLLIGFGVSTWMYVQERAAKREQARLRLEALAKEKQAEIEAGKSRQVAQFLKDMIEGVGPGIAAGRDTTLLREILDKTADRLSKDLNNQPMVQAELWSTVGRVYHAVGRHADAEDVFRKALAVRRRELGNEHPEVATSLTQVANELAERGNPQESEAMIREALSIQRKLLGPEHVDVADSLFHLGVVLQILGKPAEAEPLLRDALAMRRKLLGEEHPDVVASLATIGGVLKNKGNLSQAEVTLRQVLDMRRRLLGKEFPGSSRTLADLACVLADEGKEREAEALFREAVEVFNKAFGEEHELTLSAMSGLARLLEFEGKENEAESFYREYIARTERLPVEPTVGNFDDWVNANGFAAWILATSTNAKLRDGRRAILLGQKALNASKRSRRHCVEALAAAYAEVGDFEKAIGIHREALALFKTEPEKKEYIRRLQLYEANLPYRSDWVPEAQNDTAWMLATSADPGLRNGARAVELALRAVAATDRKFPDYLDTLAAAYAEAGEFDKAISTQEEAVALVKEEVDKKEFTSHLDLYESGSAFRGPTNSMPDLIW